MLIFPSDGSVFTVNEGSILCQPNASQEDIMFSRVADEEPGRDTPAEDQQVQFEHVLNCVSMLVVESGYADATVFDLKDLDLEVLFDCGQ